MQTQYYLFNDADATGDGTAITWGGVQGFCGVKGTFGGTTFTMEYSPTGDSGDWYTLNTNESLDAAGTFLFTLPRGFIRGVLTSGTPDAIVAYVRSI